MYDEVHTSLNNKDIPVDTPVVLLIDISKGNQSYDLIEKAVEHGFRHPIITTHFDKKKLKTPHLCMYHKYNHTYGKKEGDRQKIESLYHTVAICMKQYQQEKDNKCYIHLILSENTISYMKEFTKSLKFSFKNKEKNEQREISGKFLLQPVTEHSVMVNVDENATSLGDSERSDYMETIASFHTHPLEAYQKYNVCLAYPSVDDYITVIHIYAQYYGMFHITATLEGIYIITIKTKDDPKKIKENFKEYEKYIKKNYGIDYPICKPTTDEKLNESRLKKIKKYLKQINRLKYFNVIFKSWEEVKDPIPIVYHPVNDTCVVSDEQINFQKFIKMNNPFTDK